MVRKFSFSVAVLAFVVGIFSPAPSDAWTSGDSLREVKGIGGEAISFDFRGLAACDFWSNPPVESEHVCINRGITYRLLQTLAEDQCPDGVLRPFDLDIRLGWQFGCAQKIYGNYMVSDDNGNSVSCAGICRAWDYSLDCRKSSCDVTPSSLYRLEATSRSTGRSVAVFMKDLALPENFFEIRDRWLDEVYPKVQSGQILSEEEKALDAQWHDLQGDALSGVMSADKEDFGLTVLVDGCGISGLVVDDRLSFRDLDGKLGELKMAEACMEGEGDQRHPCLCRAMAYRVAQIASSAWKDGVFDVKDVVVQTGWNSDGPRELFVELMGVPSVEYGIGGKVTSPDAMSLADCWYKLTIISTGETFVFRGTEQLLPSRFLELRNKVKGGAATADEQTELRKLKGSILTRVQKDGFYGGFEIRRAVNPKGISDVVPSGELRYLSVDGGEVKMRSLPGGVMEDDGNGGTKVCLCQAMAFRISQMMSSRWADGIFRPSDVSVETGWNTDGPHEFWVAALKMEPGEVVVPSSAAKDADLSLKDGWYRVKVRSTGETFVFRVTGDVYLSDFLDLRSLAKHGDITEIQKKRQGALRKRIEEGFFPPLSLACSR